VGTVLIAAPEGDMAKYFASLEKVIALSPSVLIPSHGIAVGGVTRLRETLAHRRMREEHIFFLLGEGKSEKEILEIVYQGLEERLIPYAQMTLSAHIEKLKKEGRV
jgi:glyoxylase-like metal-dependent hydrolase (beta-lactamase superfamily II)